MNRDRSFIKLIVGSLGVTLMPLYLWKVFYTSSQLTWLILTPLFICIYLGCYKMHILERQATLNVALTQSSWLRQWLKGRLYAAVVSLCVSSAAVLLLSYKILVANIIEILIIVAMLVVTSFVYLILWQKSKTHFIDRYRPLLTSSFTQWIVVVPFFLFYVFYLNSVESNPGYLLNADLGAIVNHFVIQLPQGYGAMAVVMELMAASDGLKLFALITGASLTPVTVTIYLVYGACIVFIISKAAVSIATFLNLHILPKESSL